MKRRILVAIAAMAAALGLTLTASVPTQAVTMSRVAHCNWPYKASVQANNHSGPIRYDAYSPTGYKLGSFYGNGLAVWHTRWEDITVFGYSSDSSYWISHTCRL